MPYSTPTIRSSLGPRGLFLAVLATIFVVEAAVMFVLPIIFGRDLNFLAEALIDSLLLTVVVAPLLWWLIVLPLQSLAQVRTQLLQRMLTVREEEQSRIARDLHDGLGQSLTSVLVALRAIEETTSDESLRSNLKSVREIGAETHEELRRLARGLRPPSLDDLGLAAALHRVVSELKATSAGEHIALDTRECEGERLPKEIETALFRIVQESLANALKHAHASRIDIRLGRTRDLVELIVDDDGRGFDLDVAMRYSRSSQPFGLWSIQERAAMLGGNVRIATTPGSGTRVTARLPVKFENAAGDEPRAEDVPSGGERSNGARDAD